MSRNLQQAKNLDLEGIRDGNALEAATTYTGERDIRIVRGSVDGPCVFVQAHQSLDDDISSETCIRHNGEVTDGRGSRRRCAARSRRTLARLGLGRSATPDRAPGA